MALQKNITQDNGVTCTYHAIKSINLSQEHSHATIMINSYLSLETRQARVDRPVERKIYRVSGDNYETYFKDIELLKEDESPLKTAYTYIKTLPEWSDAEDI